MSPRCPLKANGPTQYIELHVPLFTGKAGLGDNKKGDIYCSLQQCDVACQITAQVGQRAPPCWEEDETVSETPCEDAFTSMTHTDIRTEKSDSRNCTFSDYGLSAFCRDQRGPYRFLLIKFLYRQFFVFQFSHGDKHCLRAFNSVRQTTVDAVERLLFPGKNQLNQQMQQTKQSQNIW